VDEIVPPPDGMPRLPAGADELPRSPQLLRVGEEEPVADDPPREPPDEDDRGAAAAVEPLRDGAEAEEREPVEPLRDGAEEERPPPEELRAPADEDDPPEPPRGPTLPEPRELWASIGNERTRRPAARVAACATKARRRFGGRVGSEGTGGTDIVASKGVVDRACRSRPGTPPGDLQSSCRRRLVLVSGHRPGPVPYSLEEWKAHATTAW
jgi:hypothetical protein